MGLLARIKWMLSGGKSKPYHFDVEPYTSPEGELHLTVRISESIYPTERESKYGKPLHDALETAGVGEVTGGGTQMGEGNSIEFVDLEVSVTDRDRGMEIIRQTMRACGAPPGTVIEEYEPEHREWPI